MELDISQSTLNVEVEIVKETPLIVDLTVPQGADGLVFQNDKPTLAIFALNDGSSPVLTDASISVSIIRGINNDTANWTITATPTGCEGTLVDHTTYYTYTVSGMTSDTATVAFSAARSGFATLSSVSTLTKVKQPNIVSSIEAGTATATPADTDVLPGVKADHSLLKYTWANIKTALGSLTHASRHQHGGADEIATATPAANAIPKADGSGKLDEWVSDATTSTKGKVQLASAGEQNSNKVPRATGGEIASILTAGGYSIAPATGAGNLDNIADGTTYKRLLAEKATKINADTVGAAWTPPSFGFLDPDRFHLERASGGRATIFYSADGQKTPCEVVLLPAFSLAEVSPYFSRARANNTSYVIGELIQANGKLYEVTTAGTTGATSPVWPTTIGDTVTDGTAVLTLRINAYDDIDPAFVVAGVKKAGLWIGRFQAAVSNGKPLVIPGQIPASVTIDNMRAYCAAFGGGCRPMTGLDWSAIQKDALRKGVVPVGNTNYGRSHKATESQWGGIRGDRARPGDTSIGLNPYTLGGTGGKLWTHNRDEWGIHDFVGNKSQWTDGYKLMDGQLYIAAHDNDPALLSLAGEEAWIATGIFFDSSAAGNDAGTDNVGTPRLDAAVANYTASLVPTRDFVTIKDDTRDLDYAAATWTSYGIQAGYDAIDFLARRTAFLMGLSPKMRVGGPFPFSASEGYGYVRNNGERFAHRGGGSGATSGAGPSYCNFFNRRSLTAAFRPVFPV